MNAQEIFDKVVNHLYTQGHPASDEYGKCMYRAPNGDKCAVGCLITDQEYTPTMEDKNADALLKGFRLPALKDHGPLLHSLQIVHDRWSDMVDGDSFGSIERQLQKVAHIHNLVYTDPRTKEQS